MFPCVLKYLKLGKHSSFELPWNNEIWQHDLCQTVLKKAGHAFDVPVKLCMTGLCEGGEPIGKVLGFTSTSDRFVSVLKCFSSRKCAKHANLWQVGWTETQSRTICRIHLIQQTAQLPALIGRENHGGTSFAPRFHKRKQLAPVRSFRQTSTDPQ